MEAKLNNSVMAFLLAIFVSTTACGALKPEESHEFDGTKALPFELKTTDGKTVSLRNFEGRPFLFVFFASWCPPCRAELTQLSKIHETYTQESLGILAVAVDSTETPETTKDVAPLASSLKLPFTVALATEQVTRDYHFKGIPTTIVLDAKGRIVRTFYGYHEMEKLEPILQAVIVHKKDSVRSP